MKKDSLTSKDSCRTGESMPPKKTYQLKKNEVCLIYYLFNGIETENRIEMPSMQHPTVQMARILSNHLYSRKYDWIMQILFTSTKRKSEIVDKRKISR